jgi:flagella basal body P-ring formation protein FlgA
LVTGHLNLPRKIAVLAHPLSAGEVIQESDIAYKEINSERVADSIISSKEELVGKTVKRGNLRANTPIRFNQVEKPTMVKRGDRVQIMFKTSSLVISNMGVAKEDGNLGQIIGFEVGNADDGKSSQKKMIHGRVIGPNQAEILKAS